MEKDRWRMTAGKRTKGGDRTEVKGPMERGQMEKTDGLLSRKNNHKIV